MRMPMLLILLVLQLCAGDVVLPCPQGATCVTVGFVYQSGLQETEGTALLHGYQFWANKSNNLGGITLSDGKVVKVELHAYDDASNTTLTTAYYEKLITDDQVDFLLGPFGSSYTVAALAVTNYYNYTVLFSQAADDSIFASPRNPTYQFGLMTEGSDYTHTAFQLLSSKGAKTMVVLRSTAGFTQSVWQGCLTLASSLGITILANLTYAPGFVSESKFAPLIQELATDYPTVDIFLSLSFLAEGPTIIQLVRQYNWKPKSVVMTSSPTTNFSNYIIGPDQWEHDFPAYDPFFGTGNKYSADFVAAFPNDGIQFATTYQAGASASGYVFQKALATLTTTTLNQASLRDAYASLATVASPFQTFYGNISWNSAGQNVAKEMILTQYLTTDTKNWLQILVGPEPYQVTSVVYPIPYGCTNHTACNYKGSTFIEDGSCVFGPCSAASYVSLSIFAAIIPVLCALFQW